MKRSRKGGRKGEKVGERKGERIEKGKRECEHICVLVWRILRRREEDSKRVI